MLRCRKSLFLIKENALIGANLWKCTACTSKYLNVKHFSRIKPLNGRNCTILGQNLTFSHGNPKNYLIGTSIDNLSKKWIKCRQFSTIIDKDKLNNENAEKNILSNLPTNEFQNQDFEHAKKLFPSPKNVLHNAFDTIVRELKSNKYKLKPHFSVISERNKSNSWSCTYTLHWPETTKFTEIAKTKQEASGKAALSALSWLRKIEKLTKFGQPILVDFEDIEKVKKSTTPKLVLDQHTLEKLKLIVSEHQNEFVTKLVENFDGDQIEGGKFGKIENSDKPEYVHKQQFLGVRSYLAKEKIALPISDFKQQFMDLLRENNIVVIKGEPGCGKSTRIPQYVLESWAKDGASGSCRIAVTQPRRIAAISLAERVANERDEDVGHLVGYQVRLKSNFRHRTGKILYCTTGILLRHLQTDPNLTNFSHIILDEAHERDVNTDLLMNLMKNTLKSNSNLKLIVMSATIDTDMFQNYFQNASIMHIPGFTFPVKPHFLDDLKNLNLNKTKRMSEGDYPNVIHEDVVKLIRYIHKSKNEGAILCFLPGWEDISRIFKLIPRSNDMSILCLHSRLQDSDQRKIFSKPPPGVRKVILATNIAETSVTIDDVVYVIDTGIHKETRFDVDKGILCMDNHWISKSSMIQRKGRAGRVQPGESFHLYPNHKFENFDKFSIPEISRTSLTKIVLDSKVYSNNMNAIEFMSQLPSPPDINATTKAVEELIDLELLDESENLTSLGKTVADFQLEPKLSKALVNSVVFKCVTPIVDIVTLFSAETELFASGLINKDGIKRIKSQFSKNSDHLALMRIFEKWLDFFDQNDYNMVETFCSDANLVPHKLITMKKLRKIHFDYLSEGLHDALPISDNLSDNDELVKAVLLSGVGSVLQHRNWDIIKGRLKKSNTFLTKNNHKATITPESVNFKKINFPSNFLIYINETRSNLRRTTIIRECSLISPLTLILFSNKKLLVKNATNPDEVRLMLKNTKIEFICNKQQAEDIIKCKEALLSAYQYYIFQITQGGEFDSKINQCWDRILAHLNDILLRNSV